MKENMLDVLIYLVEHYIEGEVDPSETPDQGTLKARLSDAGFNNNNIEGAFEWLDTLGTLPADASPSNSTRIYNQQERNILSSECRGFMLFLEQGGIIDTSMRELIISSAIALDCGELDLDRFKWILLMVLFNQPGREAAYAWMEDLVFDEMPGIIH